MRTILVWMGWVSLLALPARADEPALASLASGRVREGVERLRAEAAKTKDPALLCLLGRAERRLGDEKAAAETLARVPADAPCARQAGFTRADALLALGRADDAAALYDALGATALGLDRDAVSAAGIEALADRILADPDADPARAADLLALASGLRLAPERRTAVARRLADLLARGDVQAPDAAQHAREALLAALSAPGGDLPDDRRRAARVLAPAEGLAALAPLPADPATLEARARVAAPLDADVAAAFRAALLALAPASPEAKRAAPLQAEALADLGRFSEARRLLTALDDGADEAAARAAWRLAKLELAADQPDAALAKLTDYLKRFPSGDARAEAEAALDAERLRLARRAFAAARWSEVMTRDDELIARDPRADGAPQAAFEAGLAARAGGELAEARRRWKAVAARWPSSPAAAQAIAALARLLAFDEGKADEAITWLRAREKEGVAAAAAERERMGQPDVRLEVSGRREPGKPATVHVIARNLQELELRLHRVDAEAFLLAGGTPESLPSLDVRVIAPDKRWKVAVPGYAPRRDVAFDLPVGVPGPGLYVVTAAGPDREASAVLLVSDLDLVARAAGPDLAVAVFRRGKPVRGAKVLVRVQGELRRGETDHDGLFRAEVPGGELGLLAEDDGAPALLALSREEAVAPTPALVVQADLDRPAYRPGDSVGFRIAVRRGGATVPGPWKVWLDGPAAWAPLRLAPGPAGSVSGELRLPPLEGAATTLYVQVPGEDAPQAAAQVRVLPETPAGRDLALRLEDDTNAVAVVTEPDGAPAAHAPVEWTTEGVPDARPVLTETDAAGRARLAGPPAGLPWRVTARIAGTDVARTADRRLPDRDPLTLRVREDRLRPEERPHVRVTGDPGPVRLTLARLVVPTPEPPVPADPWDPPVRTELQGPVTWQGAGPDEPAARGEEVVFEADRVLQKDRPLEEDLAAVPAGRYRVRVVALDGRTHTVTTELTVAKDGVRLLGARDVAAGDALDLRVEGAPALLTAEGARLYAVAVVPAGGREKWRVPAAWGGDLTVAATDARGHVHARAVSVDPALHVALEVREAGAGWSVQARVTDGSGKPAAAEVALSALDERLIESVGEAPALDSVLLEAPALAAGQAGGAAADLAHGAEATVVAAALLAEAQREEETRRAERARQGQLQENAVAQALKKEVPLSAGEMEVNGIGDGFGAGGMGMSGRGAGGGAVRVGQSRVVRVTGQRERALWFVGRTDADGVVRATALPGALRPGHWRFRARALAADALGEATAEAEAGRRVFLTVPQPNPGAPGEVASLRATVVNGRATPFEGAIVAGSERKPVSVPAGEARTLDFGPKPPGTVTDVTLRDGHDERVDAAHWAFRLGEGPPDASGAVLNVAVGPGGGAPLAALALADDPGAFRDTARAARAGRAALAALGSASDRDALRARAADARSALRGLAPADDAQGAAETLLFLVEGKDALGVVRGELDTAREAVRHAIPTAEGAADRVAAVQALAASGAEVDDAVLTRLRAETLGDEDASRLARALAALGRKDEARPLVRGTGPQAALARAALGLPPADFAALRATPPPAPGLPGRAEWIAAAALESGKAAGRGTATIHAGAETATIDLAAGGVARLAVPAGFDVRTVRVDGARAPLIWRSNPRPAGDAPRLAARVPAGASGRPLAGASPSRGDAPCDPCRLHPGDALDLTGDLGAPGWVPPTGLRLERGPAGPRLRAFAVGRFTVAGLRVADEQAGWQNVAPLAVEVVPPEEAASPVLPGFAVALAAEAAAAGADPGLADLRGPPPLRARAAALRFDYAVKKGAPDLVARFEALREADPEARLDLPAVLAVARAYRAAHRPDRAVAVWRAGLGAAFLAEAGAARALEPKVGLLASLQALRALTGRYPVVPVVEETLFHLPERLGTLAEGELPPEVVRAGITATDLRLMAAAWDREFLALSAASPLAPQAGFHLVQGLLRLRAFGPAAEWAERVADAHPDADVLDGLLYAEGLARAEMGQHDRALKLFERVATEDLPLPDGTRGPAASRADARYAAARLHEARGDLAAAKAAYQAIADENPDAAAALASLTAVTLQPEQTILRRAPGEAVEIPLRVANLDAVDVRAYRIDLRTLFLRDAGLDGVLGLHVSGVSPAWAGRRPVEAGPFPRRVALDLPLDEPGAWLVRVAGGGQEVTTLLVRSDLEVDATDGRVRVHWRRGAPAGGVAVRGVGPDGNVVADTTDLRGVAHVPPGSTILVFDGEQYAFTERPAGAPPPEPAAAAPTPDLYKSLDDRLDEQRKRSQERYESEIRVDPAQSVEASQL